MKLKTLVLAGSAALFTAASAFAHTSYLRPNGFDFSRGNQITLEVGFTEDFSNSDVGVKSGDWHYIAPNGVRYAYDSITELKQVTILENGLSQEGTYHFTTGERLGRKGKMILTPGGEYKFARGEDGKDLALQEGESFITSQTETVASVYVTKGAPTDTVLKAPIGRLAFQPLTHPNETYVGETFSLKVTFDGEPLVGQQMELVRENGFYDDDKGKSKVTTNETGVVSLVLDKPGVYLLMTRKRAEAPEGAETDVRGYTTSITFEVTR